MAYKRTHIRTWRITESQPDRMRVWRKNPAMGGKHQTRAMGSDILTPLETALFSKKHSCKPRDPAAAQDF